jgi:hypothetical protein
MSMLYNKYYNSQEKYIFDCYCPVKTIKSIEPFMSKGSGPTPLDYCVDTSFLRKLAHG